MCHIRDCLRTGRESVCSFVLWNTHPPPPTHTPRTTISVYSLIGQLAQIFQSPWASFNFRGGLFDKRYTIITSTIFFILLGQVLTAASHNTSVLLTFLSVNRTLSQSYIATPKKLQPSIIIKNLQEIYQGTEEKRGILKNVFAGENTNEHKCLVVYPRQIFFMPAYLRCLHKLRVQLLKILIESPFLDEFHCHDIDSYLNL